MSSAFHQLCPKHSVALTPTAPKVIGLWEPLPFNYSANRIIISSTQPLSSNLQESVHEQENSSSSNDRPRSRSRTLSVSPVREQQRHVTPWRRGRGRRRGAGRRVGRGGTLAPPVQIFSLHCGRLFFSLLLAMHDNSVYMICII